MRKGQILVILVVVILLSSCTIQSDTHIDWSDFVKWNGISYRKGNSDIMVPPGLIGERIGSVLKIAPTEVSSTNYKPEDGMASFLPVDTELFEIQEYDSTQYIAVYTGDRYVLYKTSDSENIIFNDTKNDKTNELKSTEHEIVNDLALVSMTVKEGTVSPTGLVLVLENKSNKKSIYGSYFLLEQKIEGKWYIVPVTIQGDYGFNCIGYELNPGDKNEWEAAWEWLYGSLNNGEYRIIKVISDFRGTGDYDTYYLAAEFMVNVNN